MAASATSPARVLGRYALYDLIASGGMASVHFGRLVGPVGFARTVAIKRLHPQFAADPEFVSMFLDEARLAARIRHPNVVPTLDVVALDGELFLVMEYVQGEPLGGLIKAMRRGGLPMPVPYAVAILAGALRGLHAAHEATDERGSPLGIVHRDVSPQNILVGIDGVPRVLDFGVAKAAGRLQITREGQLKGKMAYMPPEQIRSTGTDRRTDVYAAGAVLWESLTGQRLFQGENDVAVFSKVLEGKIDPPSRVAPQVPPALDAIVLKALAMSPHDRFETARDMARALEGAIQLVPVAEIGEWVEKIGADHLTTRAQTISRIESDTSATFDAVPQAPPAPASARSVDAPAPPARASLPDVPAQPPAPARVEVAEVAELPERTEVSASSVHSAVVPTRFRPRRVIAVAGAALGLLFLVALLVRLLGGHPAEDAVAEPAPSATALPPAPRESSVLPSRVAPPTASTRPSVLASTAPPPRVSVAPPPLPPSPPPAQAAVQPAQQAPVEPGVSHARPPQPSRSHLLDGVLDSRK